MKKKTVVLSLDFIFGPISKDYQDEKGNEITNIKIIDNNQSIQSLDFEINAIWCSLWNKDDESPSGYTFDKIREKELAPKLITLLSQLNAELERVNDGSFETEDMITDYLKSLI